MLIKTLVCIFIFIFLVFIRKMTFEKLFCGIEQPWKCIIVACCDYIDCISMDKSYLEDFKINKIKLLQC